MYTLYTDKQETFKCNIDVEGAKMSNTKARLVLNNKDINLLFEGTVDSDGVCNIPIKKLKNILESGTTGNLKLEVIAEDTFFSPWEDSFQVKTSKSVKVEVEKIEEVKENRIQVKVHTPKEKAVKKPINHGKYISQMLENNGVNRSNLKENTLKVNNLVGKYIKKFEIKAEPSKLIEQILENLK